MSAPRQIVVLALMLPLSGAWRVRAQGAPADAPPPAATQPAAAAADAGAQPPAADAYSYDPAGRRDPFVSLLTRGTDAVPGRKTAGLSGLATSDLMLRGVLQSRSSYVALVSAPDGKTYAARANDRLLDGVIRSVTPQGLVIMQDVNDPLSLVKQREVRKGLRTAEDAK